MKIINNTSRDISNLTKTLESFIPYTQERLGYDKPFQLFFESDVENSKNIFGKTAYYDPATMNIHVYVDGRHDKDMLRSISHEIVHHHQNCRGDFDGAFEMGEGYAQKSPHLRNMEAEAYLLGNGFLVRDFEDNIKLGESLIMEWKENKKTLKEQKEEPTVEEEIKNPGKYIDGEKAKAGVDDDGDGVPDGADKDPKDGAVKESVKDHIKTKNQTLSEQLMKKWFKKGDK